MLTTLHGHRIRHHYGSLGRRAHRWRSDWLERSFHGRPAGFRTHTLVCVASSLLMLVTLYQWQWLPGIPMETVRTDPTRMAQGIMTGIGFLGAGVIYKEGGSASMGSPPPPRSGSPRPLASSSVWGSISPLCLATALVLGILSAFRWIEARMPSESYASHYIRF